MSKSSAFRFSFIFLVVFLFLVLKIGFSTWYVCCLEPGDCGCLESVSLCSQSGGYIDDTCEDSCINGICDSSPPPPEGDTNGAWGQSSTQMYGCHKYPVYDSYLSLAICNDDCEDIVAVPRYPSLCTTSSDADGTNECAVGIDTSFTMYQTGYFSSCTLEYAAACSGSWTWEATGIISADTWFQLLGVYGSEWGWRDICTWYPADTNSYACSHVDSGYSYFTATGGVNGNCCGDDGTNDDFYYYSANPTTATSLTCRRCLNGADQGTSSTIYGNGYWSGTDCYYGDITCTASSAASGTHITTLCSNDVSQCCTSDTIRVEGVTCTTTSGTAGTEYDRDTSSARCTDGTSTGCTAFDWIASGSKCCGDDGGATDTFCSDDEQSACNAGNYISDTDNSQTACHDVCGNTWFATEDLCCGDDGGATDTFCSNDKQSACNAGTYYSSTDNSQTACEDTCGYNWLHSQCCGDDTGEDYESAATDNSCCIDGTVIASGSLTSDSKFLCSDGEIYGCTQSSGVTIATESSACARLEGYYCNGQSDLWETQIATGSTPDDCDGTSEDPYSEGHSTTYDYETCLANKALRYDGNGYTNQNSAWICNSYYGPYAAYCNISQVDYNGNFEIYVEVADEADNYNSGGYVLRVGDNDGYPGDYNDTSKTTYPGNLIYNPVAASYSSIDSNEGQYGDFFKIDFAWGDLDSTFTTEKTFILEVGLEESSGSNYKTQTTDDEDPDNINEGTCRATATFCVPITKPATADSDCCPLGATTSTYPGKDDDDGNCISCNNEIQTAGGTGDGICEQKCGAESLCDEIAQDECYSDAILCDTNCDEKDRDISSTYCTDNSGCNAFDWLNLDGSEGSLGDNCCGDDGTSDNFVDGTELSNSLCYQGTQKDCSGTTCDAWKIGSDYYFCVDSLWKKATSSEDACENACLNGSYTWTGHECCGNLADTDSDDADNLVSRNKEASDNYNESTYGCWKGIPHNCDGSSNTCFGLDLDNDNINDTWCTTSGWLVASDSDEICQEACEVEGYTFIDGACCGNIISESPGYPIASDCSTVDEGTDICGENGYCEKGDSIPYTSVAPGTICGSYLCSSSEWERCDSLAEDYCNQVDQDNDGYSDKFCYNYTPEWKLTSEMTDFCKSACEQLNGLWSNQGLLEGTLTENCCSSIDTGEWCYNDGAGTVTRCNEGTPVDCNYYCDSSATITSDTLNYACSSASDLDCISSGCNGVNCNCSKGLKTGCYIDNGCESTNCQDFNVASGNLTFFSSLTSPSDTQNGGTFTGICCGTSACSYDGDNTDGIIDNCAEDELYTIDADNDGDIDYCNQGIWQECTSEVCSNSQDCTCMGNSTGKGTCGFLNEAAGTYDYSFSTGVCDIVHSLECGKPCDSDKNTNTREYISPSGICLKGGGSCIDIFKEVQWFGNSSLSFVNTSVDCLCSTTASCTVKVYNETNDEIYSNSDTISADGTYSLISLSEPFEEGKNTVNITCDCSSSVPTGCERKVATLNYLSTSSINSENFLTGTNGKINITVNNPGSIDLASVIVGISFTNGEITTTDFSTPTYISAGNSKIIEFGPLVPLAMFNDTKQTRLNVTSLLIFSNTTDINVVLGSKTGSNYCYQCDTSTDCPTSCPSSSDNCWSFGSTSDNFTCSYGVCCPNGNHFEEGACCSSGYSCCVLDSSCSNEEWCINSSSYSSYGTIWSCNELRYDGQVCSENRMCGSLNCEENQIDATEYCCESLVVLSDALGECSTISGGDVCQSDKCCGDSSDCSSGYQCALYGNRCVNCPESGDEGYLNSFCVSENCIGYDADCCSSNSDCQTAGNITDKNNYCNTVTQTCEACTSSLDFYCPSPVCYETGISGGDPDCCLLDSDCIEGSECVDSDNDGNNDVCTPKNIGKACSSDSECGNDLICVTNYKGQSTCVLEKFLIASSSDIDMKVGEIRYVSIILRDPQLIEDDYALSVSGDTKAFAEIDTSTVHLGPNEVKKGTLTIYGGRLTTDSTLKLFASSKRTAGISSEIQITLNINAASSGNAMAAAPGITLSESLAILVIGGVLVWTMRQL